MVPKRAALYARVSTRQHGQNPETQLLPLRDLSTARGLTIIDEYVDIGISGAKSSRPELDRLMRDSRKRRFDVVLVFRFDRLARSVKHLVMALEEFHALGIDFVSLNESIDTSTPMGKMVFTILAAVAELERALIRERVQAGVDREKVRRWIEEDGRSVKSVAKDLGIGRATVDRILGKGVPKNPLSGSKGIH